MTIDELDYVTRSVATASANRERKTTRPPRGIDTVSIHCDALRMLCKRAGSVD